MIHVVAVLVAGLIVGWLGRLLVPGPNPMGLVSTILVGLGGAVLGGTVGNIFFSPGVSLFCAVLGAAFIAWLIDQARRPTGGDPSGRAGPVR